MPIHCALYVVRDCYRQKATYYMKRFKKRLKHIFFISHLMHSYVSPLTQPVLVFVLTEGYR